MERRLYEAALRGDVATLNTLMEEDELILNRLSLTRLSETPLHIAALCGHLCLTRKLLSIKPTLAAESDSLGHSPLHLASAEGHTQIVSELLQVNTSVCNFHDQDGRIPLHLAAMRGRVEVIHELIQARPESVHHKLGPRGDSVLHLCVMYTHLDALDFFLKSVKDDNFVNSTDSDGNNILHLAVALKQMETLKYIISSGILIHLASTKNVNGFTALDVLEQCPRDIKGMEIREFLFQAGIQRAQELGNDVEYSKKAKPSSSSTVDEARASSSNNGPQNCRTHEASRILSMVWNTYFKIDHKWVEEARGTLITTAALTATVAFQAGTNPPGGVWDNNDGHEAGTSILAARDGARYCKELLRYNTVSLFASMTIIILLISGLPLKNKVSLAILTIGMSTAIACMAATYLASLPLLTPNALSPDVPVPEINESENQKLWRSMMGVLHSSFHAWIAVSTFVLLLQSTNFFVWLKETFRNCVPKLWPWPSRSKNKNRPIGP